MNVFKDWDLGIDYRIGDHLVRNKSLPSDKTISFANAFYTIRGEAIYLSRHW